MVYVISGVVAVIAFSGGYAGQRKLVASGALPTVLTMLELVGNHSAEYTVPNGTSAFAIFGWLAGVLSWSLVSKRRTRHAATSAQVPVTPAPER